MLESSLVALVVTLGLSFIAVSCAPDATKSFDSNSEYKAAAAEWALLPDLTAARIESAMAKCGLTSAARGSENIFSASFSTPGPLAWNHSTNKACSLFDSIAGSKESVASVVVRPRLSLRGNFLAPEYSFDANYEISSSCEKNFTDAAAKDAAPFQRSVRFNVMPLAERPEKIGQNGPWKKVICTMAAVSGLTQTRGLAGIAGTGGQGTVEVAFTPALPAMPLAIVAKSGEILAELRRPVQFDNITARVKSSSDPSMSAGREIKGSVVVELVAATKGVVNMDQNTKTDIQTDIGIRVTNSFGDVRTTLALGLFPWIEFFIEKSSGTIKYISTYNPDHDPKRLEILYK
jgi:hypothetical protein